MTLKNRFTLIGRVGSDPELSTGEKEFARFSIATDASYKKDGEKVERTDWHRLWCVGAHQQPVMAMFCIE